MSYPRDLDEIPTVELLSEINRRDELAEDGLCPYCKSPIDAHTCKYAKKVSLTSQDKPDTTYTFHPVGGILGPSPLLSASLSASVSLTPSVHLAQNWVRFFNHIGVPSSLITQMKIWNPEVQIGSLSEFSYVKFCSDGGISDNTQGRLFYEWCLKEGETADRYRPRSVKVHTAFLQAQFPWLFPTGDVDLKV